MIRPARADDRQQIEALLARTAVFTREEVHCAIDIFNEAMRNPQQQDYLFWCIADATTDRLCGFTCHGPTPLTKGTFDLYWIAIDPEYQEFGLGRKLLDFLEKLLAQQGARMLLVDTSSLPHYERAREFYLHCGFEEAARIRDFYSVGDDKITYQKFLTPL